MFSDGYDHFDANEDEFSFGDRLKWEAMSVIFKTSASGRRKMLHAIPAQY
jgi:hypothetical protein